MKRVPTLTVILLADCCEGDFRGSFPPTIPRRLKWFAHGSDKRIGVISPHPTTVIYPGCSGGSWSYRTIYKRYFRGNQLPQRITDANGTFEKPPGM